MKFRDINSEGLAQRVLQTLDKYFKIEFSADDPVLEAVEICSLAGGDWLMRQGDPGDALYFLVRGRLQAWARGENGKDRGRFLNEIVPGDSVGELSLLTGAPRAVGIQAIRDSLLVRLDREAFERLAHEHPAMVMRLAANVATLASEQQFWRQVIHPEPQLDHHSAAGQLAQAGEFLPGTHA